MPLRPVAEPRSSPLGWGPLPAGGPNPRPPAATLAGRVHVSGNVRLSTELLAGREVSVARWTPGRNRGALTRVDGATIAEAARQALERRIPLVLVVATSGSDVAEGIDALHGWGEAARAVAACSGSVPVLASVTGPAISGPALMLGLADVVAMTHDAFAFLSGPDMVADFTGVRIGRMELGGATVHATSSGLCALAATDQAHALALLGEVLEYLPSHIDEEPPQVETDDLEERLVPELRDMVPAEATASYDVREVAGGFVDDGEIVELRPAWAPQIVTALASVGGRPVGIVANQPRILAGTLDISASQKGARFVLMCDTFNIPVVTLVDTPGFLPGKDLEWRGMIRHGAALAAAYAEATVPRVCVVLRKAFGGAYIVLDSKGIGNDLCYAWPTAQIAVMGSKGAVQILRPRAGAAERQEAEDDYSAEFLTPWTAAERGLVDGVIDPADTRTILLQALSVLRTRRERIVGRKHGNGPM